MVKATPPSFSSKKKREAAERLLSLASAHIDNHDTARAIWCAEKALEVDSDNRNALLLLNNLYYKKKDYRKTLGISYRLKEIPEFRHCMWNNIVVLHCRLNEEEKAIDFFEHLIGSFQSLSCSPEARKALVKVKKIIDDLCLRRNRKLPALPGKASTRSESPPSSQEHENRAAPDGAAKTPRQRKAPLFHLRRHLPWRLLSIRPLRRTSPCFPPCPRQW